MPLSLFRINHLTTKIDYSIKNIDYAVSFKYPNDIRHQN